LKLDAEAVLSRLPGGSKIRESADRIKDSIKYLVVDGAFFEELGIRYIGPVDGHNFDELENALQTADSINKPVLVHVVTKKGKGYHPAENDKIGTWHGLGPYKLETGEQIKGQPLGPSWSQFISDEILSYAKKDKRVVAITPAMPVGSKLTRFQSELPEQFFDVGIAEQHAVTMAAGLAIEGFKPYVAIYSTFLQRAYDQVLHDVDRQNLNVIFGIDRSGLVGADGETHQGVFDVGFLSQFPNMTISMPKDENEARHIVHTAMQHQSGPFAIRYPRGNGYGVSLSDDKQLLKIGSWESLQPGDEITIISYGPTVHTLIEAAQMLKDKGISARVINARFIKPMDLDMLHDIGATQKPVIVAEEGMLNGGLGSQIATFLIEHGYHNPIKRIGIDDEYIEHGNVDRILEDLHLSSESIAKIAEDMLEVKHSKSL
ncbi:1-deoxy-D-xylulose-5-phosphate synthase, partial [Staphylococcus agnetis]